jgi:NAD(P)H-quinone oxidoreductase subunit 6
MNLGEGVQVVSLVILSAMTIAAAMGVVLLQNIVYSAFLLGAVFVSISGLYILLNADFVAAAQILIYVGAVNVLILFAIMLVNKQEDYKAVKLSSVRKATTAAVCIALFGLLTLNITSTTWLITPTITKLPSTIVAIGKHLFSDFLLPFELASILLLVALIGAIILARREYVPDPVATTEFPAADDSLSLLERPREQLAASVSNSEN